MNRRTIGVNRAAELMTDDPDFHPWLVAHRLDTMWCHLLTPLNDTLTVWEALCYDQVDGVVVWTAEDGPSSHNEIIETTPGKAWWLE